MLVVQNVVLVVLLHLCKYNSCEIRSQAESECGRNVNCALRGKRDGFSHFLAPPARKKWEKIAPLRVRAPNRPCSGKSTPFINNLTGLSEEGAFRCFRLVFGHERRTRRLPLVSLYKVLAAAMHKHLPCCPWERTSEAVPRKTTNSRQCLAPRPARCRRGPNRRPPPKRW